MSREPRPVTASPAAATGSAGPEAGGAKAGGRPSLRGRFLTFEGIDGCGNTTQARLLAERLRAAGLPVLETREPGGTPIGRQLRAVLLNLDSTDLQPLPELLLFLADRVQHLQQVIRPALARGEIVICDRFHDATVAYQQHARGVCLEGLDEFIRTEILNPGPDVTFWLDLDVDLAAIRRASRRPKEQLSLDEGVIRTPPEQLVLSDDLIEREQYSTAIAKRAGLQKRHSNEARLDAADMTFYKRVRAGYAAIAAAEPGRVLRIDAAAGPEALHEQIWARLMERYDAIQ